MNSNIPQPRVPVANFPGGIIGPDWYRFLAQFHTAFLNFANATSTITLYTVGTLPSPSAQGVGDRQFVTDATSTTFASVVAGGGTNAVPVYSDGSNWRIG